MIKENANAFNDKSNTNIFFRSKFEEMVAKPLPSKTKWTLNQPQSSSSSPKNTKKQPTSRTAKKR